MSVRKKHVRDRRINKPTKINMNFAMAWYKPEQWDLLKKLSTDSEKLEDTHQEWLEYIKPKMMELKEKGLDIVPIEVDVGELLSWCNERSLSINGESRAEFASYLLLEKSKKKKSTA